MTDYSTTNRISSSSVCAILIRANVKYFARSGTKLSARAAADDVTKLDCDFCRDMLAPWRGGNVVEAVGDGGQSVFEAADIRAAFERIERDHTMFEIIAPSRTITAIPREEGHASRWDGLGQARGWESPNKYD